METDDKDIDISTQFEKLQPNGAEFTKKCTTIASDIQGGSYSLLQLIEHLRGLLINSLPTEREKGMVILANVLEVLPNDFVSSKELEIICAFYADRLNDHHQVVPSVLRGILVLMQYKNIPDGLTKRMLTSLFQNVPCQQQQQSDRVIIYKIFQLSLDNRCEEILQLNFDFVYGIISAMDGERDPRNLLFLFTWLPKFLKTFTLGHLTEEMFEVIACYFPVDFRAPSQDPDNISRDSLAEALCKCLCAVPVFGEYCLPLALEKLASALRIAKLDSLHLILEGSKTFDPTHYVQHSTEIWSQLQREILQSSDSALEKLALLTLETVLRTVSENTLTVYERVVFDIIDTLKGNLLPTAKLFLPSTKIIYYVAKSSESGSNTVIKQIVPLLINTYNITTTPTHKVLLFRALIDLVIIYIETLNHHNITQVEELCLIPKLCIQAILHEDNEVKAVGLASLSVLSKSLCPDTRNHLYNYFCICLIAPQSKLVHEAALDCLRSIAQIYDAEVHQNVICKIQPNNKEQLKLYLESLIVLANIEYFSNIVLSTILDYCLKDMETAEIATGTLKKLLESESNEKIYKLLIYEKAFIFQILNWLKDHINIINTSKHKTLLHNISESFKIPIGCLDSNEQNTIVNSALQSVLVLNENNKNPALIFTLDGLLSRVRVDVIINHDVTDLLLDSCITSADEIVKSVAVQLLANLLNKDLNESRLQNRLHKISNLCTRLLNDNTYQNRINVINLMTWVNKALVVRGHEESNSWTAKLFELLDSYEEVAQSFKTIISDNYDCLNNISHCKKSLLYQQKFFIHVSSKLSEKYDGKNFKYLLAMGYLLQETPKQVFILQFNKILRLVIMCLEHCHDERVLCALLEVINDLIISKEPFIEQHMQEFLPRFLKLGSFKDCMKVRIKALQCIQNYAVGFPVYKLLFYKQQVLTGLTECLDDKKRLVRKEAVEARNRWFIIDAPI